MRYIVCLVFSFVVFVFCLFFVVVVVAAVFVYLLACLLACMARPGIRYSRQPQPSFQPGMETVLGLFCPSTLYQNELFRRRPAPCGA